MQPLARGRWKVDPTGRNFLPRWAPDLLRVASLALTISGVLAAGRFHALSRRHIVRVYAQRNGGPMSKRYIVEVDGVPPSPSPISNAVVVGNQCWIRGQLSVGNDGAYVAGTAREEAERAFNHVFRIVKAAGFDRSDIVYVDVAFIDLADVKEVNALFAELFPAGKRPARTIYQAAKLPFGGRIKVQAIAARA